MRAGKDTGRIPGLPSKAQIWGPESPCCSLNLTSPASSHRCFIGRGGVSGVPGLEFVSMGKLEMGSLEVGHSM